jgi:hypothetical protein
MRKPRRCVKAIASSCPYFSTQVKVPDGPSDEQALFLGDIFRTGWQAAMQCEIEPTGTVAIWEQDRLAKWPFAIRYCWALNT